MRENILDKEFVSLAAQSGQDATISAVNIKNIEVVITALEVAIPDFSGRDSTHIPSIFLSITL